MLNIVRLSPKRLGYNRELVRQKEIMRIARKEKTEVEEQLGPGAYTADNISPPLHNQFVPQEPLPFKTKIELGVAFNSCSPRFDVKKARKDYAITTLLDENRHSLIL